MEKLLLPQKYFFNLKIKHTLNTFYYISSEQVLLLYIACGTMKLNYIKIQLYLSTKGTYLQTWKELRLGEDGAVCGVDHALFISIIYFFHLCHSNFFPIKFVNMFHLWIGIVEF